MKKTHIIVILLIVLVVETLYFISKHTPFDRRIPGNTMATRNKPMTQKLFENRQNFMSNTTKSNAPFTYTFQPIRVSSIDCNALIKGTKSELKKAKNLTKVKLRYGAQEIDLINRTSDCKLYLRDRGYIMSELTETEGNFSIAYGVIMFKDVLQVEQLLSTIYRPQNIYCIHVDLKSPVSVFHAMESVTKCFPNVFLSRSRIQVVWGRFSVLEVQLICMKELLERNKKWRYFINLTGQEFPLKTNAELVDILTAFNGSNVVTGDHYRRWHYRYKDGGPVPHDLKPAKGGVHIVVNRAFAEYAVYDQRAKDLLNWTSRTVIPDETFFNTLDLNPSLEIPGAYKYEDFKKRKDPAIVRYKLRRVTCKGKQIRGVCILGIDYLPELSVSRNLFANKFIWKYDNLSQQCMGELLYNRTMDAYLGRSNFNAGWYATLDFVVNKI